jgi:DNA-binding response OmpR family regulator
MTALILEDSLLEATLLLTLLRANGYRVEWQRGIRGARGACYGHTFDAYVIDVNVQHDEHGGTASGIDFIRWLQPCSSRVVVVSGDEARRTEAEGLGAAFVLKRPGFAEDVLAAIRRAS